MLDLYYYSKAIFMKQFVLIHKETRSINKFSAYSEKQVLENVSYPDDYEVREFNLKITENGNCQ